MIQGGAICLSSKLGHHMVLLAMVTNFDTWWRHLHKFQIWMRNGAICISFKDGHQMAPHALVANLATKLSNLYCHFALHSMKAQSKILASQDGQKVMLVSESVRITELTWPESHHHDVTLVSDDTFQSDKKVKILSLFWHLLLRIGDPTPLKGKIPKTYRFSRNEQERLKIKMNFNW